MANAYLVGHTSPQSDTDLVALFDETLSLAEVAEEAERERRRRLLAEPACHDRVVERDKRCEIYVSWTPDRSRAREWFTRQPVAVRFADGEDLLWQLNRLCHAGRWWRVTISAPDMGDQDYLTFKEELYGSSGPYTLSAFARAVNRYCEHRVAFVRRIRREPERKVRVELRLDVLEKPKDEWGEEANYD
jgi:hypothetical protein